MNEKNTKYVEFAACVSFLEFRQEEYGDLVIDIKEYSKEIDQIQSKKDWDPSSLADYIMSNPRSFSVFEALFREQRFSNAQLIHFFFDVDRLNLPKLESVYEYALLNLRNDPNLREMTGEYIRKIALDNNSLDELLKGTSKEDKKLIVAALKMAISKYASSISKDPKVLAERICSPEFEDCAIRLSNYLLTDLKLGEFLASIRLKDYLGFKRRTADIKGLHGDFAKNKIVDILVNAGYVNIDDLLRSKKIGTLRHDVRNDLGRDFPSGKIFCTEKKIEGVVKPKDKKLKVFDIIIFSDGRPKHLFEINFYTTSGTKIGINDDEYVALLESLKKDSRFQFHWITDGNYWLSSDGRERFNRLIERFDCVYNINSFRADLNKFQ